MASSVHEVSSAEPPKVAQRFIPLGIHPHFPVPLDENMPNASIFARKQS